METPQVSELIESREERSHLGVYETQLIGAGDLTVEDTAALAGVSVCPVGGHAASDRRVGQGFDDALRHAWAERDDAEAADVGAAVRSAEEQQVCWERELQGYVDTDLYSVERAKGKQGVALWSAVGEELGERKLSEDELSEWWQSVEQR